MKWCRFQIGAQVSHGIVEDDAVIEVACSQFDEHSVTRTTHRLDRVKLLAPVIPPILYAAGGGPTGRAACRGDRAEGQREWQRTDRTLFRAKNCDTFKPFGPWIVTGLDPRQLRIVVRHNGTVWEDFSSADQIWDTATWIHEMSKTTTLHPGDVLWMGTEGADGDMVPGDVIEVEISGIGTLRNPIVAET